MAHELLRSVCLVLLTVSVLEATKCWQFTWPGDVDLSKDEANKTTCDDLNPPCFEPFVISMNSTPPNLTKLDEKCEAGECPPDLWCNTKGSESCVKWVYWALNVTNNQMQMKNYSLFCGAGHSGDNATKIYDLTVREGCYTQNINNEMLETCFCYDSDQCNRAGAAASSWLLLWTLVALAVCAGGHWVN